MLNRRTISFAGLLALGGAGVFAAVCAAPVCSADTAPDWLRQAAQEKLPDYDQEAVAVVLLDETQTTVRENGEIDVRYRVATKLLRPEARQDYGSISVGFDKETKISSLKAWTIEANGHELAVGEKDAVERGRWSDVEYDDDKIKTLDFPEPNPGNVVGFELVQRQRPYIYEDRWGFQAEVPVKTARFILDIPAGWEFTTRWFNYPEQKPQTAGNEYTWEVHDLAAVEVEPRMPPWKTVAGWAGIKYFPRDPALRAKSSGTWNDMGLWYGALYQSTRTPSPQIQQKVAELTAGMTDPWQKIRALTEYVQKNIRYMAIEIGIGGWQPHPAAEVFAHQFGDCKDKATLLGSMLQQIGVNSYNVVVHTDRGYVFPDYPSIEMNHVILAIQLPDAVTGDATWPIVRDPKLGRLLIFDPTNEHVPAGDLPWYLQENYGLLVGPDGGTLISLPLLVPFTNRMYRNGQFQLTEDGSLSGEVHQSEWGNLAADQRYEFLDAQPSKRAEVFERILASSLDNFSLTSASLGNLDKDDQGFALNYKFTARGYANAAGDVLLVRPRVLGDKYTTMLELFAEKKPRKYPIEFEDATQQSDSFDITLPAGYTAEAMPDPVKIDCGYASYQSKVSVTGGILHYERLFVVKDVIVPTENLQDVRDFLRQVAADQENTLMLRRATP